MRNIDYAALYQQVLENEVDPKKRRGTYDKLTHDQRTAKEIASNAARTGSVKLGKVGIGTGKKGVAPVAPENLPKVTREDYHDKCQALIDEGFCKDIDEVYKLLQILEG